MKYISKKIVTISKDLYGKTREILHDNKDNIQDATDTLRNFINSGHSHAKKWFEDNNDDIKLLKKTTSKKLDDLISSSTTFVSETKEQYFGDISDENVQFRLAQTCSELRDVILNESNGASEKLVKKTVSKLGAAGTTAGMFGIAALAGTASTGTAIGTLSGAAFTNAALAWIGGSVFTGTIILASIGIAGGLATAFATKWVFEKINGKARKIEELSEQEQRFEKISLYVASALKLHNQKKLNPVIAKALYTDITQPLLEEIQDYGNQIDGSKINCKKFTEVKEKLEDINSYLKEFNDKSSAVKIGVISSVLLQLHSGVTQAYQWDENELMVLEALRRSNKDLTNASIEDLSEYIQSKNPNGLMKLHNNIKGMFHEIWYVDKENSDGDIYLAEMFEATNHPGADVIITNTETGISKEFQLKATNSLSYINKHMDEYDDIDVIATMEVAEKSPNIEGSGISNQELSENVDEAFEQLKKLDDSLLGKSVTTAAIIAMAKNIKIILKGNMSEAEKHKIAQDVVVAVGATALFTMLIEL